MKSTKINISKVLKLLLICSLSAFFAFVFQYYINFKSDCQQMSKDLEMAIFLKDNVKSEEAVSTSINEFGYFNVVEYIGADKSYAKALELSPELANVIPEKTISYPSYFLVNNVLVTNMQQLEDIKTELASFDFVSDVIYDTRAFQIFFKNLTLLSTYKEIFYIISIIIFILFSVKFTLFILKKHYKKIIFEMLYGCLAALVAYAIICILAAIIHNPILILDWHILLGLIPLGAVISFLTKESNA